MEKNKTQEEFKTRENFLNGSYLLIDETQKDI